jgi:hypothetical protein
VKKVFFLFIFLNKQSSFIQPFEFHLVDLSPFYYQIILCSCRGRAELDCADGWRLLSPSDFVVVVVAVVNPDAREAAEFADAARQRRRLEITLRQIKQNGN